LVVKNSKQYKSNHLVRKNNSRTIVKKTIKKYKLAGVTHQKLNSSDRKTCIGKVIIEPNNQYDRYAIAVYNDNGKQVGYMPRGATQLFETLSQIHNGEVSALVDIFYERNGENWWYSGEVQVPLLYFEEEQNKLLKILFFFYTKTFYLERKKHKKDDAFNLLLEWQNIVEVAESINFSLASYPKPDSSWIFKLSTDFLNSNDYKKLAYLKNFNSLFDNLKPITKKNLLNRISKASEELKNKTSAKNG